MLKYCGKQDFSNGDMLPNKFICILLCCFLLSVHLATNDPRNAISFLAASGKLKNCGQYMAAIFSDPFCILAVLSPNFLSTLLSHINTWCQLYTETRMFSTCACAVPTRACVHRYTLCEIQTRCT